jgi:hypothetical protein
MSMILDGSNGVTFNDSSLQGAAASPYVLKNRLINGAMVIDQRNAGAAITPTTSADAYPVDRFKINVAQNSKLTAQQNAGSITPPVGYTNYLGITSSSAYTVVAGDYFLLQQVIEGLNASDLAWGTSSAKTVTLSFWVYSSLTGTFGGSIRNSGYARSYPFQYTISSANTWTQISVTIPGDTSGTWLTTNGAFAYVCFSVGSGTTFSGTAATWASANYTSATGATSVVGTNGATFYLTGVQLEIGTSATPFERRLYGQELANCQRYFEVATMSAATALFSSASWTGNSNQFAWWTFKTTKRASPTFALVNSAAWGLNTPSINPQVEIVNFVFGGAYYLSNSSGLVSATASAEL